MRPKLTFLVGSLILAAMRTAHAQDGTLNVPKSIEAGSAFSIQNAGSGEATLYIVGPGQVVKRTVQLGTSTYFPAGSVSNAGHYVVILTQGSGTSTGSFDVTPVSAPASLSFFAKPSRLPVGLHDGITGAVYVFDVYHNLIAAPITVSFELSSPTGAVQKQQVSTRVGAAWTEMDSTSQQGSSKFVALAGDVSSVRIISQVPGDPCDLKISAQPSGQELDLQTAPVRDCSGNAVPDGTIVTFTETYPGGQSTVDVPLKRDIAEVKMPTHDGATFTVASGIVLGNQIRWGK
ncbi:MAG: hypothetical protein ABSE36_05835 [Terracidiphilus sp.]